MHNSKAMEPLRASVIGAAGGRAETDYVNGFIFWSLVLYMSTLVYEGPLRYVLSTLGLGTFIYLRDALSAMVISLGVFQAVKINRNIYDPLIIVIYTLLVWALLGLLIHDVTLFPTLFGLKILSVFLLGMSSAKAVEIYESRFRLTIYFFVVTTILGVITNYILGKLPWEGLTYETSFGVVSTTKEWWTEGERRLPGFARASFDAAMIIGLGAAYLISRLSYTKFLIFIAISFVGIYLTTTKGMLLALALVFAWRSIPGASLRRYLGTALCFAILVGMIILPAMSCALNFSYELMHDVPKILSSFAERIVSMWPKSCSILVTPYSWFIGAGIGSIGVPQQYSNLTSGYSAADNLFVYLYVMGGIPFAVAFIATVSKILQKHVIAGLSSIDARALLIAMLAYGVTTNMQEQPFFAILAGILSCGAWTKDIRQK
ncbi:hypothetical protein MCEMIEM13_00623 [Comamonadaceae bacterium]